MEQWNDIKGFEGLYMISSAGRVKALEKSWICAYGRSIRHKKEHFLSPTLCKDRRRPNATTFYRRVYLSKGGKVSPYLVHVLVALHFIPNPFNKPQVNHINGNKNDNNFENLEWVTQSENMIHAIKLGLK